MKNRNLYIGAGIAVLLLGYVAWKRYGSQNAATTAPTNMAPTAAGNMYPPITPVIYPGGTVSGATTAQTTSAWYDQSGSSVPPKRVDPLSGIPYPVWGSNRNLIPQQPFGLTVGDTHSAGSPPPTPFTPFPLPSSWTIPPSAPPTGIRLT